MKLRIRHLSIRITSANARFGVEIPFETGLNVIRAANSMGKSTAIQAIVYGLGLEAVLSTSQGVPFAHVLTHSLNSENSEFPVLESEVLLEFENERGDVWTTQRTVKGSRHKNLVTVHFGPLLTQPASYERDDYYVRQPGAARNEAGFHKRFADFLGWKLPEVETFDGPLVPLYVETIFPLMCVEQKRGWSDIQARFPTQFRIKEVSLRATEFLLRLDAYDNLLKRRQVDRRSFELTEKWKATVDEAISLAQDENMRLEGVPTEPSSKWPPEGGIRLLVFRANSWTDLESAQQADTELLKRAGAPKSVANIDLTATRQQLATAEEELSALQFAVGRKLDEIEQLETELRGTKERIIDVESDLRRNRDEVTLRKLGSQREIQIAQAHCPTCHQSISDSLVSDLKAEFMTVEENISFLGEQREMFLTVAERTNRDLERAKVEVGAQRERIEALRRVIRALNRTLISAEGVPSAADIEERLRLQDTIERRRKIARRLQELQSSLAVLSEQWRANEAMRASLPKGALSALDEQKLSELESLLRTQAQEYGMSSINTQTLSINRDSYLPMHEGFVLTFDLSASDLIRTIWAYINGLLELTTKFPTNHLGIAIFDEPKQQDAAAESLAAFLSRASRSKAEGHQVIIATSEPLPNITAMLHKLPAHLLTFDSRVITRQNGGS